VRKKPGEIRDESDVKTKIVKPWYDARRAWHYMPVQTGRGESGILDHIGCVPVVITQEMVGQVFGRFVAVESKRPGRRKEKDRGCSDGQKTNLVKIVAAGGVGIVCDSLEDLERIRL
jgi:ribosomal protein S19